jgi:inosine-uridine nucleoside N-ribohydrolase
MPLLPPFPAHRRVVLDTDTYNEVDDQFALAHLLLSPETITVEAVHAAPFFNDRSTSPADGMEKSYAEILRVLDLVQPSIRPPVFRGSSGYLSAPGQPVESAAARDLIQRALRPASDPLYVIAIGAITNVASALLLEPKIAEKMVVIWLGGHAPFWPHNREFNLEQDVWAAQVVLGSSAPLGLIPGLPVASHLVVSVPELEKFLAPQSALGAYLTAIVRDYAGNPPGWSKPIWDIAASGWVINPDWVEADAYPAPEPLENHTWKLGGNRPMIHIARQLNRDAIFADFYAKCKNVGSKK